MDRRQNHLGSRRADESMTLRAGDPSVASVSTGGTGNRESATEVALFHPSLLKVGDHVADDHGHVGEDLGQAVNAYATGRVRREDDAVLRDAVVHEDLNSHQSRAATGHLRIQKKHRVVVVDVVGQLEIVQLRLAGPQI